MFRGVWLAEWGMRFFQVISIKQRYGGHARQAAHIALGAREGGYLGRFVVLVDDDIDPANMADVMWAMSTRCDPQTSIEIADQLLEQSDRSAPLSGKKGGRRFYQLTGDYRCLPAVCMAQ